MDADHSFEQSVHADELELCPHCGENQLVPPSPEALMRLCLGCGVVSTMSSTSAGETTPAAV
jgi:hypothetical protein